MAVSGQAPYWLKTVSINLSSELDRLAIFGGTPLFDSPRPIGQLAMPSVDSFLTTLRPAYEARQLTGNGGLVRKLEAKLALFHGTKYCVSVANAGLGLIMLVQTFAKGRPGNVIMPAFSYRGLPHIVQWARQMPRFCDVDETSHTLDLQSVAQAIDVNTTSILAVCNFNSPGNIDGLCRLAADRNIAVFFDSVDALGSTYHGRPLGSNGRAEVFSTHATKTLNGFEGGYITTNDSELFELLCWQREYALPDLKPDVLIDSDSIIGLHATFNEMHAAMSLASLEEIESVIARNKTRASAYIKCCAGIPGFNLIPYTDSGGDKSNYRMVVADVRKPWPLTRDETVAVLRAEGASIDAYWSPALHQSVHAPPELAAETLPVAEALADRFLHLPVGELVSLDDIDKICDLLQFINRNGLAISTRLSNSS